MSYEGIRPECLFDFRAIDVLHREAFGQPAEAALVAALRASAAYDPGLSLVAVGAGEVRGHILFSRIEIDDGHTRLAAALAPMAVRPRHQRQGVGSALVRSGLEACTAAGYGLVVVVGHADYYPRFGFQRASPHGLRLPYAVPDEAFMVAELTAGALDDAAGMVVYPPQFAAVC